MIKVVNARMQLTSGSVGFAGDKHGFEFQAKNLDKSIIVRSEVESIYQASSIKKTGGVWTITPANKARDQHIMLISVCASRFVSFTDVNVVNGKILDMCRGTDGRRHAVLGLIVRLSDDEGRVEVTYGNLKYRQRSVQVFPWKGGQFSLAEAALAQSQDYLKVLPPTFAQKANEYEATSARQEYLEKEVAKLNGLLENANLDLIGVDSNGAKVFGKRFAADATSALTDWVNHHLALADQIDKFLSQYDQDMLEADLEPLVRHGFDCTVDQRTFHFGNGLFSPTQIENFEGKVKKVLKEAYKEKVRILVGGYTGAKLWLESVEYGAKFYKYTAAGYQALKRHLEKGD